MEVMLGNLSSAKGCIGCGKCSSVCAETDPWKVMMYVTCVEYNFRIPQTFMRTGYHLPIRDNDSVPKIPFSENGLEIMPGCFVRALLPFIEYSASVSLNALGIKNKRLEAGCCTFPIPYRIMEDEERNRIKMDYVENDRNRKIITLCPGCSNEMSSAGADAVHIVDIYHQNIQKLKEMNPVNLKVAVQPGCHLLHKTAEFKEVVSSIPGIELVDLPIGCCGKMVEGISESIMKERQQSMKGLDAVIVGCPSCFSRYDAYPEGVPVLHISELVSMASGDSKSLEFHKNVLTV